MDIEKIVERLRRSNVKQLLNYLFNAFEKKIGMVNLWSHPILVDITPTMICNLNCIFCIKYKISGEKYLSVDAFNRIIKMLSSYPVAILFCSGGEPFMNKNMTEFLRISKKKNIDNIIVTNGMLLTEDICKSIILNSKVFKFKFSFDGTRKKTVESIRIGVDYDVVINNMRTLSEFRNIYNKQYPKIHVRYAIMKRNIEELPSFIRLSKSIGIDQVDVNYVNFHKKMDISESLYFHQQLTEEIFKESMAVATSENIKLILPPLISSDGGKNGNIKCYSPWEFIKIEPDGSVKFCYKAWDVQVGNILEVEDFKSLWNNNHYKTLRRTINQEIPYYKYCSVCESKHGIDQIESHDKDRGEYQFNFETLR